jgi:uncharacterized membrane protein YfcA
MTPFYLALSGVGLLLGLLGGGGSLLLFPILVYLGGFAIKPAIALTLSVVGITSLVAVARHAQRSNVCWRNGLAFGLSGMLGGYGGGRLAGLVPENLLMMLFLLMMLATALSMLLGRRLKPGVVLAPGAPCPTRIHLPGILFDGLLVGLITGLVGVGGGFVIVPALNLLGGLAMRAAIGTSLLVIGMNSMAAMAGYFGHEAIDWRTAALLCGITIPASLIGQKLSEYLPASLLRQGFGLCILLLSGVLLSREISTETLTALQELIRAHQEFFGGILTALGLTLLYWIRGLIYQHALSKAAPNSNSPAS